MSAHPRRLPHEAAAETLVRFGDYLWLDVPRFSPRWLKDYRPFWIVEPVQRHGRLARLLEKLGLLGSRFRKVAHFDVDSLAFTIYRHSDRMRQAAAAVSAAVGFDVKVIEVKEMSPTRGLPWFGRSDPIAG